jgi:hypothetical protein
VNIVISNGMYLFYNSVDIRDTLPIKNFVFKWDKDHNCYLADTKAPVLPEKIYDVDDELRRLVAIRFKDFPTNMGILLMGNKGQGKSVTAKMIAEESQLPVIHITKSIPKEVDFVQFLKNIEQDYVLFIDEFEKLFEASDNSDNPNHTQQSFLSLMDGAMTSDNRILFLMTSNSQVSSFLLNRPSRIRFLKDYIELDETLFDEIVEDRLQYPEFQEDLRECVSLLNINIDILITIIDDINLYNMPFSKFKHLFNYVVEDYKFAVYVTRKGQKEEFDFYWSSYRRPTGRDHNIAYKTVLSVIDSSVENFTFQTYEDEEDEDGNSIRAIVTVRLKPHDQDDFIIY